MLLAALSAGARDAGDVIDRVSREWGEPNASVCRAGGAVGAWHNPIALNANDGDGWLAEGWLDLAAGDLSPDSLQQARGDFALFGMHAGGLVLASGRAGGYRPIFVAWPSPELVVACTRLAPILALQAVRPPLDLDYLAASLLSHGPRPPESTAYLGIRCVPAGEAWVVRPGMQRQRWPTVAPLMERELPDNGDLAIQLRRAITDATRRSARNATRLAVLASGGLDSSMLLSLLVSLARNGEISAAPEAITYESVVPPWHDDRPHLLSLEGRIAVRAHRVLPVDAAPSVDGLMVVDAMPAQHPTLSAARPIGTFARAHGVDVVLTGDGGDQVLDGNPRLFGELARKGQPFRALKGALRTRGVFYEGNLGRFARFIARPLLEPFLPRFGLRALRRLRLRIPPWAGPALVSRMNAYPAPVEAPASMEELPGERYARLLRWPTVSSWSLMRLQEEVVGGYTLRSPLLDDDFLRFAATLPPLSLMQGGFLRGLMREAMRDLVPEDLRLRKTKGTFHWFVEQTLEKAGGIDVLAGLADVRMLAHAGLVAPKPFRAFFDDFAGTSGDHAKYANYADLWCVLSTEAFLREHAGEGPARQV